MRIKMIDPKTNRIVWAGDSTAEPEMNCYSSWIYDQEIDGNRIGHVTWPVIDGWFDHKYDQDSDKCCVSDCTGWCQDESNACSWKDSDATFCYNEWK